MFLRTTDTGRFLFPLKTLLKCSLIIQLFLSEKLSINAVTMCTKSKSRVNDMVQSRKLMNKHNFED